ncbi:MAG: hypothetical protein RMJ56_08505 [Gemmataceae bacterium]|nr:hypothetical protein [Gemmata sp.]MDW8197626.1 hypothetical protein [Gemmataceae bacterium]
MSRAILGIVMACCVGRFAEAAPVPPPPKDDDSIPRVTAKLLQHRKIQIELKMTPEQRITFIDRLADIEEEYKKKLMEALQTPNPQPEHYEKVLQEQRAALDKVHTDCVQSLSATQRQRLRQIDWHLRGAAAFADPFVQEKLQFTAEQKKKSEEIVEHIRNDLQRYFEGPHGIAGLYCPKLDLLSLRKDRLKEMERLLSDEQKAAWKRLLGPAPTTFDVDEMWLYLEELADPDDDP